MNRPKSVCEYPVVTADFFPTILELAGLEQMPEIHCDGINVCGLLKNQTLEDRPIFWHYPHYGNNGGTPGSAVLYQGFKLIQFFQDGHFELYYISNDIGEVHELSKEYPEKLEELKILLFNWQQEVCAVFPKRNANWTYDF